MSRRSVIFLFLSGNVQLYNEAELNRMAVDFLKTTDVPRGEGNESVRIREVYDHKLRGKIFVVEYGTRYMRHPEFMCEALEVDAAILTIDSKGHMIFAFCIQVSQIWDLINQRWLTLL